MILGILTIAVIGFVAFSSAGERCILCHGRDHYCGGCAAKATRRLMAGNKFQINEGE